MLFHFSKYLFAGFSLVIFVGYVLKIKFSQKIDNFIVNLTYNCIYVYSKTQIFLNKYNKILNQFIENKPTLLKIKNKINDLMVSNVSLTPNIYIKNGKIIDMNDNKLTDYDFMIHSFLENNKKCINKKIIYDINKNYDFTLISNVKFILVEFKFGDDVYKIDLKNDEFNYYIVGNNLTKAFFIYYIKFYFNLDNISLDKNCGLSIIDQDVNKLDFDFTNKNESILLNENDYSFICSDK